MKWLNRWKTPTLLPPAVIDPGFSTANVDWDANGISTYPCVRMQRGLILWKALYGANRGSISHGIRPAFFAAVGEP